MRVLAIGATGFIGAHVVPLLVEQGHEVAVFTRGNAVQGLPNGVHDFRGDRDRLSDSQAELEKFAPGVVLDLILYTEEQARELVKTFRDTGARIVAASSADVYRNYDGLRGKPTAPPDPVPLSEDAPLRESRYPYRDASFPFSYAHDYEKILVEQLLLSDPGHRANVLRLPMVYGPGDTKHRLRSYLRRMADHEASIPLEEGQSIWRWTRGYVENVAAAMVAAVANPQSEGRVYNVGDDPTFTEVEWVERIGAVAGWKGDVVRVPGAKLSDESRQLADWRYHLWTDTRAIRSELRYVQPVPIDEALRRTVEWESA